MIPARAGAARNTRNAAERKNSRDALICLRKKQAQPFGWAVEFQLSTVLFHPNYVAGLRTLLSFYDLELDLVAFLEALVSFRVDRTVVHKNICVSVITADEAKAFRIVEPLYGPFQFHLLSSSGQSPTAPPPRGRWS